MPRFTRWSCVAVLTTLIASWSVHAAQTKAAGQATGGACLLITKEEVAAVLAVAVTGPKETNVADAAGPGSSVSSCGYEGSGLQSFTLSVWRLSPSVAPMHRAMCAKAAKDGLDGLGDLACWYNDKHQELHAYKGTTFVSIQLRKTGDTTEAIKGVMKKVLGRLE